MLNVVSTRQTSTCDGASRRDFLRAGVLGMTGLSLADLLRARATAGTRPTSDTSVVWLWLAGGPSHIETFDPKMNAPAEFRSTVGALATNLPGMQVGGVFPRLARVADKMAFVRSFAHGNSGHNGGTHWVMTGYDFPPADNGAGQNKPGLGAILARQRGANSPTTGLPNYVRMGSNIIGDGPVWLGRAYGPFDTADTARNNMNPMVPLDRLGERRALLHTFDAVNRDIDRTGLMRGLDSFETQAFDLLHSRAREAFDINREAPGVRELYGNTPLARQMLLARRLCEAGVGFVTINFSGWDMHAAVEHGMRDLGPQVDRVVSAFIQDVHQRGQEKKILLVVTGDFGREPRINVAAGRHHWAPLSTLALAGGGLRMGQVIGESTSKGETPKSRPISPQDLMATVFHVLGIPQDVQYNDPTGRPVSMIDGGRPIAELL